MNEMQRDKLTARPWLLKQANLSLVRSVIKVKGTATRAEIAEETKISSTTVRTILNGMVQRGEIESIGFDQSKGGRRAERYRIQEERYHGAAFCMADNKLHALLVNVCGEIVEIYHKEVGDENYVPAIQAYLDAFFQEREIRAIGLGVPGIVMEGGYWRKNKNNEKGSKIELEACLAKRYGIPVIMENDLNAIAIGYGRSCVKEALPEGLNMVYLFFEKNCISAGIIAGGRIIRGAQNFAGEIGLITEEGHKTLGERISDSTDDIQYAALVTKIISWVCGILNPQYIVLGGPDLRENCLTQINNSLSLPVDMKAEIFCSGDMWRDYHAGMAYLTAGKIFEKVQFIK